MAKSQPKHLNTRAVLAHNLVVKYHSDRPPDAAVKRCLCKAVNIAGSVMLSTVWEIDKIVLFHRDEKTPMTEILDKHFCMNRDTNYASTVTNKKLVNAKNRRAFLAKVRKVMLSTSFHLNTGVYLLDVDAGHRTTVGDFHIDNLDGGWKEADSTGTKNVVARNIEGYVQQRTKDTGPIHVAFELCKSYSPEEIARVIIHEATHSFCRTTDVVYCWDANYDQKTPAEMLTNADSFAFAAMSIKAKRMLDSDGLKNYTYS